MSATFIPISAFDFAKAYVKNMPLEVVQVRILDSINKMIWMAAPWRWSIGALPNVTLVANTQDYSIVLPADYLYPITSYITDQTGNVPRPLAIQPALPVGGLKGQPSEIAVSGAASTTGTARFLPQPGTVPTPSLVVISQYKKIAPVLTLANINTAGTLVMDDEWAFVYESGVLWLAYLFGDDARAGTANYDSRGQYTFTGQRAVFEANIHLMRDREKLLTLNDRSATDQKLDK